VKAAELYYQDDKTMDETGLLLHLTRWKVGRLLTQARQEGIIRITIVHPRARKLSLERQLSARFGLADAVVVPSFASDDESQLRSRAAGGAARYLQSLSPAPKTLGISWGRTLHDVAVQLSEGWTSGVNVVQINGGVSLNRRASSAANTAVTIAQKGGGTATLLPSPAILQEVATKRAIESDRTVRDVLDAGVAASTLLFSAGAVDVKSVLVESGYLTAADIATLVRQGAVADIVGRFIAADGSIIDHGLDDRTVGLSIESLKKSTSAIAVIAGRSKHEICHTVVSNGFCSVLVTDEETALFLLEAH
jgi:deoxyribonucleoside regulator